MQKSKMPKKRILIIEDDRIFADIYMGKLKDAGFEMLLAPDGETGLEMIKKHKPDLIILDLILPKMSGFDVLQNICQDEASVRCIPTVVVTNLGQADDRARALRLGAREYFVKPNITFPDVLQMVLRMIG